MSIMEFDYEKYKDDTRILDRFASWYIRLAKDGTLPLRTVYENGTFFIGGERDPFRGIGGIVLYRQENLQVQLFVVPPHCVLPEHTHPNVDSYESYLGGPLFFEKEGKPVIPRDKIFKLENEASTIFPQVCFHAVKVPSFTAHGATTGKSSCSFLSIQHWKNGIEPTSVERDWNADEPAFPEHEITSNVALDEKENDGK